METAMAQHDLSSISFRPLGPDDCSHVPLDCHGEPDALAMRIRDLGAAAILAYDGIQHVGQLQFRRYEPGFHCEHGIHDADYWGDFGGRTPRLPERTLAIHCYHVGQLSTGMDRDPRYQGRGLGVALLDQLIEWATERGFGAVVAKATPSDPAVMRFMGGQPERVYAARGFTCVDRWVDQQLYESLVAAGLIARGDDPSATARVGLCVRGLSPRP
jgi:GNAT superfamily N-acetyltransferase